MLRTKGWGFSSLWTYGLAFLVGLLASPGRAQDQETPIEQPLTPLAGQAVSLQAPTTVFQGQSVEIVLQVRNGQGEPLDGVPVAFQVDPTWSWEASVFPSRTMTQQGIARVQFRADRIGVVDVMAGVGPITKRAAVGVVSQHNTGRSW
jgi:hypothetical protein